MQCNITGCDNDIKPGSKLKTCENCRSGIGRWNRRRPVEVLEWRRKLTMYNARLTVVIKEKDR
jgi:hypothetical protein